MTAHYVARPQSVREANAGDPLRPKSGHENGFATLSEMEACCPPGEWLFTSERFTAMGRKTAGNESSSAANLGFEAKLWLTADKLRNNMDAAEYKHVVLGLIFLKYISDSFDEHHAKLLVGKGDFAGANPEDKDEYLAANVFWVPKKARWPHLQARAEADRIQVEDKKQQSRTLATLRDTLLPKLLSGELRVPLQKGNT